MSQDPLINNIIKASGDVSKLCDFFASRQGWELAVGAAQPARDLIDAAATLDARLKTLIENAGAETKEPTSPTAELLPIGALDGSKLTRFASFLCDLDSWFEAQIHPIDDPEGSETLRGIEADLACIIAVVGKIASDLEQAASLDQPGDVADGGNPPTPDDDAPKPRPRIPEGVPKQLVLDDTDDHPLVQDFQGIQELTESCQQLIDDFLAAWEIEYSYYNRKKLLERILRWVSSAPEGQVLVIKMKTVEKPFEPYPSYISRDVIEGKVPEETL